MKIRKKGMQEGRQFFTAKIRKGHEDEDIEQIAKFQESTIGKQRYKVLLDGDFTDKEAEQIMQKMIALNIYRNTYTRANNPVFYSKATLNIA